MWINIDRLPESTNLSFSIPLLIVSIFMVHISYNEVIAQEFTFPQQPPTGQFQQQQPLASESLIPYENPQLGVRVLVPSDSQIIEESQEQANLVSNSGQFEISLVVIPSHDQILEQLITEAQSDPSVIAIQETVLSNNAALLVLSRYPESAEFEAINVVQFFTFYGNNLYVLQFMLNAADLETLNPLLMRMHSSYQIIG